MNDARLGGISIGRKQIEQKSPSALSCPSAINRCCRFGASAASTSSDGGRDGGRIGKTGAASAFELKSDRRLRATEAEEVGGAAVAAGTAQGPPDDGHHLPGRGAAYSSRPSRRIEGRRIQRRRSPIGRISGSCSARLRRLRSASPSSVTVQGRRILSELSPALEDRTALEDRKANTRDRPRRSSRRPIGDRASQHREPVGWRGGGRRPA